MVRRHDNNGYAYPKQEDFDGCKVALFLGDYLVVSLRDNKPDIKYPGLWDFPAGRQKGTETPFETLAREVHEELGLTLPQSAILLQRAYLADFDPRVGVWFFVAHLTAETETVIVFGNEGPFWALMSQVEFSALPNAVPNYAQRLADWADTT